MNRSTMNRAILLGASAIVLPFANGVDSIPVAAFLAPLLLLRLVRTSRPVAGLFATLVLQSVAFAIQFRGMIPVPNAVLSIIILMYGLLLTIPYVVDRLLTPRLAGWPAVLVFPCAWAATEYLYSFIPYGTWGSAAYALYGSLPLLQLLAVTGLWGVTFLIGLTASAANCAWELIDQPAKALRAAGIGVAVIAAIALGGSARLSLFPPGAPTVRVASISRKAMPLHPDPKVVARFFSQQLLTPDELSTIRASTASISDDLLARVEREATAGARIIFWGEANAPILTEDEADLTRRAGAIAMHSRIYLGIALASWHGDSKPPLANKFVLIGPDGAVAWEYFKAHPVPGGEAAMSMTRDGKLHALETPYGRLTSVICFDADFPQLLAQAGALRADIILDPSNDWKAIDPWHTQMASFRAIEQGASLVRHTSLGLSSAFDYEGHVLASMDHYRATDHVMISQVPTQGTRTIYSVLGDWFAWLSLAVLVLLTTVGVRARASLRR